PPHPPVRRRLLCGPPRAHIRRQSTQRLLITHPPPTHLHTLSLHDALPISRLHIRVQRPLKSNAPRLQAFRRRVGSQHHIVLVILHRKSAHLNSSHVEISYAVFCLKKKRQAQQRLRIAHRPPKRRHTRRLPQ